MPNTAHASKSPDVKSQLNPPQTQPQQPQQSQNANSIERPKSANLANINKTPNLARSATLNENNRTSPNVLKSRTSIGNSEDSEDTMNNLRKTFAGIFGNSNL